VYQVSERLLLKVAKTMVASTQQCSGPFNFLPSSSLRSDGPASCRAFECQVGRLDLLARYAGLSGQKNPPDVQRHEMYFLLKLVQTTSS
jgi:hypothetical protein